MARVTRMVLNRNALHEIDLAMAEGFEALAREILDNADVPDQDPLGIGLVTEGGFLSYVDGKKVGGTPGAGKPRAMKVRGKGVVVGVGFPFPARFNEIGTSHQPARPFLFPSAMQSSPDAAPLVRAAIRKRR